MHWRVKRIQLGIPSGNPQIFHWELLGVNGDPVKNRYSKINETCEDDSSLLSLSKTAFPASFSDDELDFEKQLDMQAKKQQLQQEISDEPNFDTVLEKVLKRH